MQIKPGLSAYASDPKAAAESLIGLLDKAVNVVPKNLRASTPVRVGVSYLLDFFSHFPLPAISLVLVLLKFRNWN